jgi:hypothetical protein
MGARTAAVHDPLLASPGVGPLATSPLPGMDRESEGGAAPFASRQQSGGMLVVVGDRGGARGSHVLAAAASRCGRVVVC